VDIGAYESQDVAALIKINPFAPGTTAIVITGSPKNDLIVIKLAPLKIGALAVMQGATKQGVSVTLNGVQQGLFFPTSHDILIAAGRGFNRVLITGTLARTVRLHAIDCTLHVTRVGRAGSVTYILRGGRRSTRLILGAAVVGGPLTNAASRPTVSITPVTRPLAGRQAEAHPPASLRRG